MTHRTGWFVDVRHVIFVFFSRDAISSFYFRFSPIIIDYSLFHTNIFSLFFFS